MKVKIKSYQLGGAWTPPFSTYRPIPDPAPQVSSSGNTQTKTSSDKDNLNFKTVLDLAKNLKGLPNDVSSISKLILNIFSFELTDENATPQDLAIAYSRLLNAVNLATFSYDQYNKAYDQAKEQQSLADPAITDQGNLICQNVETGEFKELSLNDLSQEQGYRPLTNSEILKYRAESASMIGQNGVLPMVQSSVGIKSITDNILKIGNGLKADTDNTTGYIYTAKGQIFAGYEQLIKAASNIPQNYQGSNSIVDLHKFGLITESGANQAQAAISYIYKSLSEKERTLLKIKSGTNDEQGALGMIQSLIISRISNKSTFTDEILPDKTKDDREGSGRSSKGSRGKEEDSALDKAKATFNAQVIEGLGHENDLTISAPDGASFRFAGVPFPTIRDHKDNIIKDTTVKNMLDESDLSNIVKNMQHCQFGDIPITRNQLEGMVYHDEGLYRCNLPINGDGYVDFDLLDDFREAQAEIKQLGENPSTEQVNEIMNNHGLNDLYNKDGSLNDQHFAPFIAIHAYTTEDVLGKDRINSVPQKIFTEVSGDEKDKVKEMLENNNIDSTNLFGITSKNLYSGTVFIPISTNLVKSQHYGDVPLSVALQLQAKADQNKRTESYTPDSARSDVLKQ